MPIPRVSSKVTLLVAMMIVIPMTGCNVVPWARGIRSLEESVTDWRDFVWGKRAYYQRYGNDQSKAFMDGFLEGYHDILSGGDGCLPVVPPKRYWGWRYQSANGQGAISDWFEGFKAGVQAAKEDGLAGVSCVPLCSQYDGMTPFSVDPMPIDEGMIEEPIVPDAIPTPSVQPGLKTKSDAANPVEKTTDPSVRPASAIQPLSRDVPLPSQTMPLGSGTIKVSPMIKTAADSNTTSRRSQNQPLPTRQTTNLPGPWNLNPVFSGAGRR